jgi:cell division protein FtsI (penicillin-binding protein 3)
MRKYYQQKSQQKRILFLLILTFFLGIILLFRLFQIQVLEHGKFKTLAEAQHWIQEEIPANRGEIYVKDRGAEEKYPLATNITRHLIYAVPPQIKDKKEVAKKLSSVLKLKENEILENISDNKKFYVPLKHRISDEETEKTKELNLGGIFLVPEPQRIYPEKSLAAHILGFVNNEGRGQYGIEGYFNKDLKGKPGFLKAEKDVLGTVISWNEMELDPAYNGDNIILTIDRNVQYKVEKILEKAVKKHAADSGSIIVMEPKTGKILAMACYPTFDPNKFYEVKNYDLYKDPAIADIWEPGSIFKIITMAAALNEGKVNPETTYVDTGSVTVGGHTIRNASNQIYGKQTMTRVLEQSINTGIIFAKDQIGNETFYNYIKNFGFGVLTGIELDGEGKGEIPLINEWTKAKFTTSTFGQGIAITPLQMATAVSAIANGGKMMEPQIVEEIIHADEKKEKIKPRIVRQTITASTAAQLGAMMVQVIEKGHGYQAQVPGYYIAGKTGTAQVPLPSKLGYDPNKAIHSFAGFAPVDNPRFAILVKIDVPRDVIWAESSAAPVFGELATELLNYYKIPPTR